MDRIPQFSDEWRARFWTRPLDAVPYYRGSPDLAGIGAGIETGNAIVDDVPPDVNGFRIDSIITGNTNNFVGGFRVRLYTTSIRNPAGPTFNIPQFYEENFMAGTSPFATPVAWLIIPGTSWQLNVFNSTLVTFVHAGVAVTGWYF